MIEELEQFLEEPCDKLSETLPPEVDLLQIEVEEGYSTDVDQCQSAFWS